MMKIISKMVSLLLLLAVACSQAPAPAAPPATGPSLPTPLAGAPPDLPDVKAAGRAYLDAWLAEDYAGMYALLTSLSQDAMSEDEFIRHYRGVAAEAALSGVDYEVLSALTNPDTAQVSYNVTLHSSVVGDIERTTLMNLRLEKGAWRVQWDDTLVLPELVGDNHLAMDQGGYAPSRGNIYDRQGSALVAQTDATALELHPDQIDPKQADVLFEQLYELTGLRPDEIQGMYANFPSGADWYLPLGQVSADQVASKFELLSSLSGLAMRPYKLRYYLDGGIAPHVVGYVSSIPPDELQEYLRQGYRQDDRVGRSGMEQWGETYLAGKRGGALYVLNNLEQPVTRLAQTTAQPSQAIYTTLDKAFQVEVQKALASFRGAVVVLERDTGRVLAMASSPGFNPNAFEPISYNSTTMLSDIATDPAQPLLNRATQGQYPLGSVFKVITMAAGLESGHFAPDTPYQCGYTFEELPGAVLHDWTYDYHLQDGRTAPSGLLTLSQGLMRSCNPWFWHIGLSLYNAGETTAVSDMARGFGLGKPTGIFGLQEEAGQIPDPANPVDAVNMAIGQGDVLVTPLQVATFMAALGNGGTLYRPQVVERIASPDGQVSYTFEPQKTGNLTISPETLLAVQQALVGVIRNEKPRGTAWHRFTGLDIPVAGKTGTAQSGSDRPHAWFAGYTFAEREDRPDIAAVVLVERIGEGSDYAAPIFRRIVELYFSGQPQKLYWWESEYNVTVTPTPEGAPAP